MSNNEPRIIVFGAPHCMPCQTLKKSVLPKLPEGSYRYIDVSQQPEEAVKNNITGLPTILFTASGIKRGMMTLAAIEAQLEEEE